MANNIDGFIDVDFKVLRDQSEFMARYAWGNEMRGIPDADDVDFEEYYGICFRLLLTKMDYNYLTLRWPDSIAAINDDVDPDIDIPEDRLYNYIPA